VAKPLMKLMYHRQALEIIRKNENKRLSTEMVEIYMSYLPYVDIPFTFIGRSDVAVGGTLSRWQQRLLF
jgi:hypothetical protein